MSADTKRPWIEVNAGRFECPHCGATWVGSWHGPKSEMTCLVCEKPLALSSPETPDG